MENEPTINSLEEEKSLTISDSSKRFLNETGKWGKFISIVGFVFIGILVLVGLFAGTILSSFGSTLPFPGVLIGLIYIVIALIYLFPILYLYRFSTKIKIAFLSVDDISLEKAFENLKSHYKFMGILTIIVLGLYILLGLGSFLMASLLKP
jgi:hypothetical protein